ncbi:MAG TPA: T9SS type A sorting domain-containing protein, partial [Flavobacteriales bacterium]|nr:T9SS type A sorting domain-containing protein [Flavobacteriales bacterium]
YYNGRYCVTPEYPSGTYAYFLNTDATGNASYPNMVGPDYYGTIYPYNTGPSGGTSDMLVEDVQCYDPTSPLAASLNTSTNATCNGSSNGSATVTASGGSGTYTYSWSPSGGSAATASSLAAGTYTCTVSDGSSTVTVSVTITQPAAIVISGTVTNPTCNTSTNGAVNVTVSGGSTYDSANPGLVISEVHANPTAASDSPFEFVELVATKAIDFTTTPYTVVFSNNGIATSSGWINGGSVTYAFQISAGSVTQGQVVYVGGSSMTPTTNVLRSINTGTTGGDGSIGNSNTAGVLGNGGANADAVAVFSTDVSSITNSTVPVDAIFFGTAIGSAMVSAGTAGYQLPVNDKYAGGKLQTTSSFVADPVSGQYLKATGAYNIQTDAWSTARTWANTATFTNLATSVSLTGPYTYSWSSGPTTEDLSSLAAGTYTVTVTDAAGCTNNASYTVTAPAAVSGTTSITHVNCFGNSTGAVDLTPSGGNGSYIYSWTGGATTQDISSKAAGTYSVTITDGNGCTGSVSAIVTQPSAALSASATTTSASCSSSTGSVNLTVTGGTAPYMYLWSNGATTEDISALSAGTYTVTVTDSKGCTTNGSYIVTSSSGPSLSTSVTNILCNGASTGAINLTVTGGTGALVYAWSNSATTEDISSLAAGTYSVTVTDATSCSATTSVTLTQPTALSASASSTSILCNGGSSTVTVNASGGTAAYSGTGSFTQTAGTYSYTVTDANGCAASTSITITQPTALSASASSTSILCNGGSSTVVVSASGGTASYSGTGSFTQTAGTTSYTVTDANGCSASTSVTITQPTAVAVSASSTSILCNGGSSTVTVTASGGTPVYSGTGTSTQTAGTYSYTVTDANGCSASTSITITQPSALSASATSTSILCNGGSSTVTVNASGGTPSYAGTGTSSQVAGTYSYTVTDANGCTSSTSVTITEPTALSASSTAGTILCNGGSASVVVGATGGTPSYSGTGTFSASAGTNNFTVTDANGCTSTTSVTLTEPAAIVVSVSATTITCNGDNSTVTVSATGGTPSYSGTGSSTETAGTYSYTVSDANGCTASSSVTITEPAIITGINTATVCSGGSVTVGSNTYTTGGTYTDNLIASNGCDSIVTTNLTVLPALSSSQNVSICSGDTYTIGSSTYNVDGTYVDTLTSSNGCDSVVTTNLTVNSTINIATTNTSTTVTAVQTGAAYQWVDCNNGMLLIPGSGATAQTFNALFNGDYAVVITMGSCSDTSSCVNVNGVGLVDIDKTPTLLVYPNPTNGFVTIESNAGFEKIVITNLDGQIIHAVNVNTNSQTLNVKEIPNGIYMVTITGNSGMTVHKRLIVAR